MRADRAYRTGRTDRADRTVRESDGGYVLSDLSDLSVPSVLSVSGIALLEVLIALTILATAGLSVVRLIQQAVQAQVAVEQAERTMAAADRVLSALILLKQSELDQRVGQHPLGEFVVDIQRPKRWLYRLALSERAAPARILLVTVVYRDLGT